MKTPTRPSGAAGAKKSSTPAPAPEAAPARRPAAETPAAAVAGPGAESLDKVRDILFGAQMRDADRRFQRLEERLVKDQTDIREESRKRLETLEQFMRGEVQSIMDRLKTEQSQRGDAIKELAQEMREAGKAADKRHAELEDKIATAQRDLRQAMLDQTKALRDEMRASQQDIASALERSLDELRSEKADRSALAELFSEMAMRLSGDEKAGK